MDAYVVTTGFSVSYLGENLVVGDTVGKLSSRVSVLVAGTEYGNLAFYDWVGTADSLNYLSLTGVLPDPPAPGSGGVGGTAAIVSGASVVTVAGAAFGFVPSGIAVTVLKPVGGSNLFATVRSGTVTADGFVADLSAPAPAAGYSLSYWVVQ